MKENQQLSQLLMIMTAEIEDPNKAKRINELALDVQAEILRMQSREATLEKVCKQAIDELENDKKQLSRELHDQLGQAMTSILLQLKLLQKEQDIAVIHDRLGGLRYLTQQTIEDMRNLSMNLRPAVLENLGLVAALDWYCEDFQRYSEIEVDFCSPQLRMRFPNEIEIVVYRAVQESLTNVARHAEASKVFITLQVTEDCLQLRVEDNGKGIDTQDIHRGLGLMGMEERVRLAKGDFSLESQRGVGTTIVITLPFNTGGSDNEE